MVLGLHGRDGDEQARGLGPPLHGGAHWRAIGGLVAGRRCAMKEEKDILLELIRNRFPKNGGGG